VILILFAEQWSQSAKTVDMQAGTGDEARKQLRPETNANKNALSDFRALREMFCQRSVGFFVFWA
jgi:hypothetical protein